MGTTFELRFSAATHGAIALAEDCFELIDDLEMMMTIYRDDSVIARTNATYHQSPVELPRDLYELLKLARAVGQATDGAYDIASGTLSRIWGFVKGPKRVPSDQELQAALERTGSKHITFDEATCSIQSDTPGVELNLGSIGKGYAIDRVVGRIRSCLLPTPAMVHGGRSSLYALGHQPGTLFDPWTIALHNPVDPERPLIELKLVDQAVGTSGATFQSFESEGRSYGHIIDPRTGIPPSGPLSVTVIAPTAAEADAISTALYITGPSMATRLIEARPGLGALFLRLAPDSPDAEPELLVMNVPQDRISIREIRAIYIGPGSPIPPGWA
jgi:thiamine biosynthesis lipoprotein